MTEQKTKILINRLSRLWKEIGLDERKKYGNFETFVKHKIETEPFSVRGELERFLIKWLAQPEVQNDFGNDFEAYVHFMLNEKNVQIVQPKVESYDASSLTESLAEGLKGGVE